MAKKTINRIYPDAEEKLVKNTVLYANGEKKLFFDEAYEHPANAEEVKNLFFKGLVVLSEVGYAKPIIMTENDGIVSVKLSDDVVFTSVKVTE